MSHNTSSGLESVVPEPLVANPATDDPLSLFLLQVVLILVLVRILGKLLSKLRQPSVIGEIISGVLLGPSAFGYIPNFSTTIFPASSLTVLSVFAQVGLIFFMFYLGLEVDISLLTRNWKAAVPVAVISIAIPFCTGIGISYWLYTIEATVATPTVFLLFIGTSFSFTAFPVLARVLASFRLVESGTGLHTLSIAAIDDACSWCVLALTLSYAGGGSAVQGLYTMLLVVAFIVVLLFIIRPFLLYAGRWFHERTCQGDEFNRDYVGLLLFLLACASIWTEIIGIQSFFGAFAFGVAIPKEYGLVPFLAPKIELLVTEFLLPIYFVDSGLSTELGKLNTGYAWGQFLGIFLLAVISKLVPVMLMTRLTSLLFYVDTSDPEDEADQTVLNESLQEADIVNNQVLGLGSEMEMQKMLTPNDGMHSPSFNQQEVPALNVKEVVQDCEDSVQGAPQNVSYEREENDLTTSASPSLPPLIVTNDQKESIPEPSPQSVFSESAVQQAPRSSSPQLTRRTGFRVEERTKHPSDEDAANVLPDSSPQHHSPSCTSGSNSIVQPLDPYLVPSERFKPLSWRTCFAIGVLMNTRGLVALVALNIGLQKSIIGPKVFSMMVLMSILTTFMTSPIFDYVYYRPYMKRRREKREERRKEALDERRLIRQKTGLPLEEDEEETDAARVVRLKKEEEEEGRAFQEELERMSILVHTYEPTPRGSQSTPGLFGSGKSVSSRQLLDRSLTRTQAKGSTVMASPQLSRPFSLAYPVSHPRFDTRHDILHTQPARASLAAELYSTQPSGFGRSPFRLGQHVVVTSDAAHPGLFRSQNDLLQTDPGQYHFSPPSPHLEERKDLHSSSQNLLVVSQHPAIVSLRNTSKRSPEHVLSSQSSDAARSQTPVAIIAEDDENEEIMATSMH